MNYFLEPYAMILSRALPLFQEELLSKEDRHKVSRYIREEDKNRFLAARMLFYLFLRPRVPSVQSLKGLYYDKYGKPHLDINGIHFNWSHSGEMVALIAGNTNCGIDVELHSDTPLFDYRSICTDDEWEWIHSADATGDCVADRFYQLWTAKESVLKAIGSGLSINPLDIHIRYEKRSAEEEAVHVPLNEDSVNHERIHEASLCHFTCLDPEGAIFNGISRIATYRKQLYSLSWCTSDQTEVIKLSVESLLEEFYS